MKLHLRTAALSAAIPLVLAACAAKAPRPQPAAPRPRPDLNAAWQQRPAATPPAAILVPTPDLRESEIDTHGVVIPDTTSTADINAKHGTEGAHTTAPEPPPEVVASVPRSESLLPRIKSGIPANQAAALRLIEQGRLLIEQKHYDQASDTLERGLSIDPSNAYGYYYLAQVNYLQKDYKQAVAFATRSVSLGAREDRAWLSRSYTLQGEIFEEIGRYREARNSYTKALQADSTNLAARVGASRVSPAVEAPAPAPE